MPDLIAPAQQPNAQAALADLKSAVAEAKALIDPVPSWMLAGYATQMADIFNRLADATAKVEAILAGAP